MEDKVTTLLQLSNSGRHAEALKMLAEMTPTQIEKAVVGMHPYGIESTDRLALREAAILVAQRKVAEGIGASANRVAIVGWALTVVGLILAYLQWVKPSARREPAPGGSPATLSVPAVSSAPAATAPMPQEPLQTPPYTPRADHAGTAPAARSESPRAPAGADRPSPPTPAGAQQPHRP